MPISAQVYHPSTANFQTPTHATITTGRTTTTTTTVASTVRVAPCPEPATVVTNGHTYRSYREQSGTGSDQNADCSNTASQSESLDNCANAQTCCGIWYRAEYNLCAQLTRNSDICAALVVDDANPGWNAFYSESVAY